MLFMIARCWTPPKHSSPVMTKQPGAVPMPDHCRAVGIGRHAAHVHTWKRASEIQA